MRARPGPGRALVFCASPPSELLRVVNRTLAHS